MRPLHQLSVDAQPHGPHLQSQLSKEHDMNTDNYQDQSWFNTTPEATLRAESILVAFHENRVEDIGAILTTDYDKVGNTDPVALLVALVVMADRLADYGAAIAEPTHRELLRTSAATVAQAVYNMEGN
jgi:hypothetical protein